MLAVTFRRHEAWGPRVAGGAQLGAKRLQMDLERVRLTDLTACAG
jgi:hypothetical protein